jgi:glyceraldehyde-3-phosphate dehydrogenase (NADP+)
MVSFTGSAVVGWGLKQQSGKKKVVLELGGNAGVILTPTSNLNMAITKCIKGGFSYSGQVCIHTQRIIVHQSIYQQFVSGFLNGVKALKAGNPLNPETEMSVLIDEENALRIESWVQEALDAGATLLCGGIHKGSFFEPTVLSGTNPTLKVCNEEIFGPVVTVESYERFTEAVDMINQGPYGLQAGVFTDSILEMNEAFNLLEVGGVIINDVPTFRADHMPYGGVKNSGFGREGVKYAIHHMMEPRVLVKNS